MEKGNKIKIKNEIEKEREKQSTKERILLVALDMFSIRGYSAVSIRDISKCIGIKESSIYYHFINKQDIFNELLRMIHQITQNMRDSFNNKLVIAQAVDLWGFIDSANQYMSNFLLEDKVFKIINMLTIEKYLNANARTAFQELLYDIPLMHHEAVFLTLTEKGLIKKCNLKEIAMEYQSIILFVFYKNFPCNEYMEADKKRAFEELSMLMQGFYQRYFKPLG